MTMSSLYPYGKPSSRGTHNETAKNLALLSSIINGIMMESRLRISLLWGVFHSSIEPKLYHIYTVKIVFHKSRNLIGTVGIAKFGPKQGHVFQSNNESLLTEAPSSSQRAQRNKRRIVISLIPRPTNRINFL